MLVLPVTTNEDKRVGLCPPDYFILFEYPKYSS